MKRYLSACGAMRRLAGLSSAPLIAISLAACATSPVTSPTVVAIPGQGQSYEEFSTLNSSCRIYAQSVVPNVTYSSTTAKLIDYSPQRLYNTAYSKCMTGRGAVVDSRSIPPGYPYPNPSYPFWPGVIVYFGQSGS
jgi:hypothetical protein